MKVNLHTHTYRCYHAKGTDEEYVEAAIAAGYQKLGFSDHTPFPYDSGFFNGDKMEIDQLEDYISSVEGLREKYRGEIEILLGLECEAVERFFPFLQSVRKRMDYLILGNHGDKEFENFFGNMKEPSQLWHYLETAVKGMETGLFLYLAHPDLMLRRYPVFDETAAQVSRELCREANRLHMPVEYNLMGIYRGTEDGCVGYPSRDFWRIAAEENVTAVVGVDAHSPDMLREMDVSEAQNTLRSWGVRVLEDPTDALK